MFRNNSKVDGFTSSEDSSEDDETTTCFNLVWKEILKIVRDANNSDHTERNLKSMVHKLVVINRFDLKAANTMFKTTYKSIQKDPKYIQCRVVFFACILQYILFQKDSIEMFQDYLPESYRNEADFKNISDEELKLLIKFRNVARITFAYIPAKNNKSMLIPVWSILEGGDKRYVTGSEATPYTKRRTFIFATEGDCQPVTRPERKLTAVVDGEKKQRKRKIIDSDSDSSSSSSSFSHSRSSSFDSTDFSSFSPPSSCCPSPKSSRQSGLQSSPIRLDEDDLDPIDWDMLDALAASDGIEVKSEQQHMVDSKEWIFSPADVPCLETETETDSHSVNSCCSDDDIIEMGVLCDFDDMWLDCLVVKEEC